MNKVLKSVVMILAILFLLSPFSFGADETDFKEQIKSEDGSLFEKNHSRVHTVELHKQYLILQLLMR